MHFSVSEHFSSNTSPAAPFEGYVLKAMPVAQNKTRRAPVSAWMLCTLLLLSDSPSATGAEWVSFHAATTPASRIEIKRAQTQGMELEPRSGTELRGLLAKPEGAGPFPAVVMLHGCRGARPYQKEWARRLASWGYVALLVNSFFTRHAMGVCAKLLEWSNREEVGGRVFDAYGALEYLSTLPYVDKSRIAVMGWAYAASLSVVSESGAHSLFTQKFKAAVALNPSCRYTASGRFIAPVLVLAAGRDDWTLAEPCRHMARAGKHGAAPIQLKVYPDAYHGFDDPEISEDAYLDDAYNPNKNPARGATLRYNRAAHADAVKQVQAFLERYLYPEPPRAGMSRTFDAVAAQSATWIVDPNDPGENLPPVGRSLFDILFTTENGAYDVPFPFTALIERIENQLPREQSGSSTLKKLLIPLGRSLQRNAAAPDFFKYPRVVVAVDTEPAVTDGRRPMLLKDRLFLGYQERSNVIEVISYNERAARFEFQVVKDYGAGLRPQVRYANRAICTSCHQNGAPIFSRAAWDETNGNRRVAARLAKEKPLLYTIAANLSGIVPAAVDNATDRANLFAAYQLLWRQGCSDDQDSARAIRCRAGAFAAMLQHRLGAFAHFDKRARLYKHYFVPLLSENWHKRWPRGLYIPNPNIPNREPLLTATPAAVPSELDPLNKRPPLATWSVDRELNRVIIGLAEFIPKADLRRLDAHLFDNGLKTGATRQHFRGPCEFTQHSGLATGDLIGVECHMAGAPESRAFDLVADMIIEARKVVSQKISSLAITDGTLFTGLVHSGGPVLPEGDHWVVNLDVSQIRSGRHARLANGDAVVGIQIRWPKADDQLFPRQERFTGAATLTLIQDFSPVNDAIAALVRQSDEKRIDVFSSEPFRGTKAMQALFSQLGLTPTNWCCDERSNMPPVQAEIGDVNSDSQLRAAVEHKGALRTFYRYCATCHQTENRFPPNFLSGEVKQVMAKLTQCAPRILFRLYMWQLPDEARPKSPMPPVNMLHAVSLSTERWRDSVELAGLQQYITTLLTSLDDKVPRAEDLLAKGYENTRRCLPQ